VWKEGHVNINGHVWVRLTDDGWVQHDRFYRDLGLEPSSYRLEHGRPGGWQRYQLWEIMSVFGPGTFLGGPQLFVDNEIRFVDPDGDDPDRGILVSPPIIRGETEWRTSGIPGLFPVGWWRRRR
jgi:hypothetical protein